MQKLQPQISLVVLYSLWTILCHSIIFYFTQSKTPTDNSNGDDETDVIIPLAIQGAGILIILATCAIVHIKLIKSKAFNKGPTLTELENKAEYDNQVHL